eukprot:CAMPEP_0204309124 /NCGR_PEP_ID=MMETSP0469-20131031/918_1 /ASSEMBLY_ACC=CAM_ASM_000384 /TAXON_ID=2969 /ORGANISM="Oxyrrhis marina" /LENGTH=264 /DNA_ID=CAMNT_0051288709 /DNA_START=87 /DNA_END=877 /DNA_ORIENTATION=-
MAVDGAREAASYLSRFASEAVSHAGGGAASSVAWSPAGEAVVRKFYDDLMKSNPGEVLKQLAVPMKEELLRSAEGAVLLVGEPQTVVVAVGNSVTEQDKEVFSIGRHYDCDVQVPDDLGVSRMNVWVFNFPGGLVVVDGWSLSGTRITGTSESAETMASIPGSRRTLVVPHDEPVSLRLGAKSVVTFNGKTCLICEEHPRNAQLSCGHQAFCQDCAARLVGTKCPLCRTLVEGAERAARADVGKTYVGRKATVLFYVAAVLHLL